MSKSGAVYYKNRKLRKENASLLRAGRKIVGERDAFEMAYNEAADHADMLEGQVKHLTEKYEEQGVALSRSIKAAQCDREFLVAQMRKAYDSGEAKQLALAEELRKTQRRAYYYGAAFWIVCTVTAIITNLN